MKCERCGKEFNTDWRTEASRTGKYPLRFCSSRCAHARTHSFETKAKTSETLKGRDIGNHSLESIAKSKETKRIKRENSKIDWICPQCNKHLRLVPVEARKRKYCSGTCRNVATNPAKNGSVSKAEILLCEFLEVAGYIIDRNRRDILNGLEIDIWIPVLQTGIEYNGVYHLQPIHGEEALQRVQARDSLKKKLAEDLGIRLIVLEDTKSTPARVRALGKKVLQQLSKG
jgi:endogenous inhibitor of DNA gyrase (YacG/DUF329 family)